MVSRGALIAQKMQRNAELAKARKEGRAGLEKEIMQVAFIVKYTLYATMVLCVAIWSAAIVGGWLIWPVLKAIGGR